MRGTRAEEIVRVFGLPVGCRAIAVASDGRECARRRRTLRMEWSLVHVIWVWIRLTFGKYWRGRGSHATVGEYGLIWRRSIWPLLLQMRNDRLSARELRELIWRVGHPGDVIRWCRFSRDTEYAAEWAQRSCCGMLCRSELTYSCGRPPLRSR